MSDQAACVHSRLQYTGGGQPFRLAACVYVCGVQHSVNRFGWTGCSWGGPTAAIRFRPVQSLSLEGMAQLFNSNQLAGGPV